MTSKHTPGPWTWGKRKLAEAPVGTLYGKDGAVVCDFGDATQFYPSEGELPSAADARLIAAAPDLLETLQRARQVLHLTHRYDRLVDLCDAAIAKATGGDK